MESGFYIAGTSPGGFWGGRGDSFVEEVKDIWMACEEGVVSIAVRIRSMTTVDRCFYLIECPTYGHVLRITSR